MTNEITYKPIGVIHSPNKEPKGAPIQAAAARGIKGTVEVYPEYAEGLKDLEGFSHVFLLFHLHLANGHPLIVKPFLDDKTHGVFATRSPCRPNLIGLSTVRLRKVDKNILYVEDLDVIDGTPLLDINPYVPKFDNRRTRKIGWLEGKTGKLKETKDDGRFLR